MSKEMQQALSTYSPPSQTQDQQNDQPEFYW